MPKIDPRELLAIFAGGFAGAVARVEVDRALATGSASSWPWATFTVNIVGAFLLGYFATRLQERLPLSAYRRPFLGTGFCGGLTTFSTLQVEILKMLDVGNVGLAVGYAGASIVCGLAAVGAAQAFVRRVRLL
jgi:fluoride exporter